MRLLNKKYFVFFICLLFWQVSFAQTKDSTIRFDLAVSFGSYCCGVPDAAPLKRGIIQFKKKYHIKKIKATRISPLGREGEYLIGFNLQSLTPSKRKKFILTVQSIAAKLRDKGFAESTEQYTIDIYNLPTQVSIKQLYY
jgi:hypothetical protein